MQRTPPVPRKGYTGDTYCTDCGTLLTKGEVIPAKGHDFSDWTVSKEASCTEAGEETPDLLRLRYPGRPGRLRPWATASATDREQGSHLHGGRSGRPDL